MQRTTGLALGTGALALALLALSAGLEPGAAAGVVHAAERPAPLPAEVRPAAPVALATLPELERPEARGPRAVAPAPVAPGAPALAAPRSTPVPAALDELAALLTNVSYERNHFEHTAAALGARLAGAGAELRAAALRPGPDEELLAAASLLLHVDRGPLPPAPLGRLDALLRHPDAPRHLAEPAARALAGLAEEPERQRLLAEWSSTEDARLAGLLAHGLRGAVAPDRLLSRLESFPDERALERLLPALQASGELELGSILHLRTTALLERVLADPSLSSACHRRALAMQARLDPEAVEAEAVRRIRDAGTDPALARSAAGALARSAPSERLDALVHDPRVNADARRVLRAERARRDP